MWLPTCIVTIVFLAKLAASDDSDTRKPSMFKVGDEWLALPEVMSVLDFDADDTPASMDDIEAQMNLRSTRYWGRLYIDGWPQTVQYFRAHFGIEPPMGKKRFVFAEPRDACTDLTNAEHLTADHVILANRGTCTYGTKSKNVGKTNASAIIIINNEPGIDHVPGPDAHDIVFSVSEISQIEGQLLEAVYDDGPMDAVTGFGRVLEGYMVPINCGETDQAMRCKPATREERHAITTLSHGGTLLISNTDGSPTTLKEETFPIEYLMGHFGTKVYHSSVAKPVVVAKPAEACGPIENDVKGKFVLVRRGGCPFVKKSETVQTAGGVAMIVSSMASYIVRMGVEPRWKGLNTAIPVVMVSKRAYSVLVAESYTGGLVSFDEEKAGNVTITTESWEIFEKLVARGEGWPRSESYIQKKYEELLGEHKQWPDRVKSIEEAYAKKTSDKKETSPKSEL